MNKSLFKHIKVITNPSNNYKSQWLVLEKNIYPDDFRHVVRISQENGNTDCNILKFDKLIDDKWEPFGYSSIGRLNDDIVSDFTMHDYTMLSDRLRRMGYIYNKKTNKLNKIKQI